MIAVGNLFGPLLLARPFDSVGRKIMITGTYVLSGVLLLATAWLFSAGVLSAVTMTATPNCVVAISAGVTDHYARVTVGVWDSAPPPAGGWESGKAAGVRLDSGYLEIQPTDTHVLRIGPPGRYELRAYSAGRARIAASTPRAGLDELRGVESFLFQFWPAVESLP